MKRNEFLRVGLLGAGFGLIQVLMSRCGSSPSAPSDPGDENTFTSSSDQGHTHTVRISKSEVQSPPSAGISRSTSSASGHTHAFAMTQTQLMDCNNGATITITTSIDTGHSHTFQIAKWF